MNNTTTNDELKPFSNLMTTPQQRFREFKVGNILRLVPSEEARRRSEQKNGWFKEAELKEHCVSIWCEWIFDPNQISRYGYLRETILCEILETSKTELKVRLLGDPMFDTPQEKGTIFLKEKDLYLSITDAEKIWLHELDCF